VQTWSTVIKAGALFIMALLFLIRGNGFSADSAAFALPAMSWSLMSAVGVAMISVMWAYEGWQWASFSAGETTNPQRTFPLGMAFGTIILVTLYCLANVGYVAALGPAVAAESDSIAAAAVGSLFGDNARRLVAVAILISIFSAANGTVLTAPRVFYAMARDGVFFRQLAAIHPGYGTPAVAVVACGAWAMILAATGTFEQLLTYVVFTGWLFYALGAAAIFAYRRQRPDAPRPFRVPGYPLTPALFVLASGAMVINTIFTQPMLALIGIGVVLTGLPAFFIWRRASSKGTPL
jgi:APA family basic amino acid/polyamine antiporter